MRLSLYLTGDDYIILNKEETRTKVISGEINMKTKIGVSAGAYAAFTFFLAYFGGYTPLLIAVGFVLIFENNEWLKATVLKAVVLSVLFSLLTTALRFIPNNMFGLFRDIAAIFNGNLTYAKLSQVITALTDIVGICELVLFIILMFMALKMKTIKIGFVEKFVEKHLSLGSGQ